MTIVTASRGVFGNPPPPIGQEIDSFCSNTLQKTCVGLVVV
jgi:hypothetical protein